MTKRMRMLTLVLAVLMIVPSILAGCGGSEDPATTTTAATTTAATTTEAGTTTADTTTEAGTTTEATTPAGIDLGGYEFLLNNKAYAGLATEQEAMTAEYEELLGLYAQIEADLNCIITVASSDNSIDALLPACVGGVKLADFICCRQYTWIPLAMMGGIRPLDSMIDAGLDLYNENNFNQVYTQMSALNGHIWALDVTGKFEDTALGHFYAFNPALTESVGYSAETLYEAVRNGEWNYDMMLEIARKITNDTDGDGVNDVWGIALDADGNEAWTNGTGPIVFDEAEGKWVANLSDPQLLESVQFMADISADDVQTPVAGGIGRGDRREMFFSGNAGFAGLYGGNISDEGFQELAGNGLVGLLPLPKGPSAENYIMNMVDLDTFVCQISNKDWENSAKIMNAIGAAVTDFDAYKEGVIEAMGGNEEAVNIIFDYALPNAFLNIGKCSNEMHQLLRKGFYTNVYELTLTPAAAAETWNDQIQAELDATFQQN